MTEPTAPERSRRTTRAIIGVILAAAVIAGSVVGVAAGVFGPSPQRPPVAGIPGPEQPPSATPPGRPASPGSPAPSSAHPSASSSPGGSPSVGVVPDNALLTEADANGGRGPSGDSWVIDPEPPGQESCLDEIVTALAPAASARRDFQLSEVDHSDVWLNARTLQFVDDAAANAAWQQLGSLDDTCRTWAESNGRTENLKVGDRIAVQGDDDTRYVLISYVDPEQREDDPGLTGLWHTFGITRSGSRIGLVETVYRAPEFHFEDNAEQAEETGLPLNPMWTILPAFQQRLAA